MHLYKIVCLSLCVAVCGCGTQKVVVKQDVAQVENVEAARPTTILYPESTQQITSPAHPKKPAAQTKTSQTEVKAKSTKTEPAFPQPKITFSAVESANIRVPGNNPLPSRGGLELDLSLLQEDFCYPYPGKVISNYGYRGRSLHTGVDIKAVPGDTIRAAMAGVVRMSKVYSGYGNVIVIRHYCGIETVYAHQIKNLVQPNEVVSVGQAIGLAGRTGRATTEHLHFELRAASEHIDPSKLLDYNNMSLREGSLIIKNTGGKLVAYNGTSSQVPMVALEPATPSSTAGEQTAALSSVGSAKSATATASTAAKSTTKPSYHVVRKGDNLSQIARKYSVTVAELCRLNKITKDGILSLGQRIKLK